VCLCFQTVAEVKAWAIGRQWGPARRDALERTLSHYVVLPFDARMADVWASVTAARKLIGQPIPCGDGWIVAAALRHDLPLLTHNARHYRDIPGLKLVAHSDRPK
jgi:tRNA(fMet)-specific endonuclease VapC